MSESQATKPPKRDMNALKKEGKRLQFGENLGEPIEAGSEPASIALEIQVTPEIYRMVDEASKAIVKDPNLFQRDGCLVALTYKQNQPKLTRAKGTPSIYEVSLPTLRERLSRVADFVKKEKNETGATSCKSVPPPKDVVESLADRKEWPGLRYLMGVREAPFLRPDGTICQTPGYDSQTGFLLVLSSSFPKIPDHPNREEALAARDALLEMVVDFPYAGAAHRSGWFALLLTLFARPGFDGPAPLFGIDANTRGSGKSRLTDIVAILLTGREATRTTQPKEDEEMRKRILAILSEGDPFAVIDNVRSMVGGSALESVLTGTSFKDRVLQKSSMMEVSAMTVWACSGNNLTFTDDMTRRVLPIRLESPHENPEERDQEEFTHPKLLAWVKENRARLVAAVLTILRAWYVAGKPTPSGLRLWGSFENWSELILSCLLWIELPNPMAAHQDLVATDGTKGNIYIFLAEFKELLKRKTKEAMSGREMLEEAYPTRTMTSAGYMTAHQWKTILEDLTGVAGGKQISSKQLGSKLSHYRGRRIHNLRLLGKDDGHGTLLWSVESLYDTEKKLLPASE